MPPYLLEVNGERRSVDVPDEMPLLWVLRDELQLCGSKYGCGKGLCGACTVHVDGQAVRGCLQPVRSVVGRKITTIEGLDPQGQHPLQRAWVKLDVAQCGYCQAGQIMQAAALLKQQPRPNAEQIDAAMAGNLCRCGSYLRIRAAITAAAEGTP